MNKLLFVAIVSVAFAAPAIAQGASEPLRIVSGDKTNTFQIELAATPEARAKGLVGRDTLAKDQGMLFDYRQVKEQSFITMKGVKVDLDMLFIDGDGTVIAIATNARQGSLRPVAPGLGAAAVLQIAGGQSQALGIKPGDKVKYKMFGNGG